MCAPVDDDGSPDGGDSPNPSGVWRAVPGHACRGGSPEEDLIDPRGCGPTFWFQQMDAPRPHRNRIHIDVWLPHDQAGARIATALAASGGLVTDEHALAWWILADTEGNEVHVATTMGPG